MPTIEIDKVVTADKIGRVGEGKYIWHACIDCGKERWVLLRYGEVISKRCYPCGIKSRHQMKGSNNKRWNGGRHQDSRGYIVVWVSPEDFFHEMSTHHNYVAEHRLVVAKSLNRCLLSWEVIHHKNGVKSDNRLENLKLLPNRGSHNTQVEKVLRKQQQQIEELQKRVTLLEVENILLKESGERLEVIDARSHH